MPRAAKPFDLGEDVVHGAAPMLAAELRDGAKGAAHVAALGDLHVRVGQARGQKPRRVRIVEVARRCARHPVAAAVGLIHELDNAVELGRAQNGVDLGNFLQDLAAIALGETAGHDEGARLPSLLQLGELEDGIDRFLARPVDEGAGVDDQALGALGLLGDLVAGAGEHPQHQLGVDLVLGTTEGREMDLHDKRR